MGIENDFAGIHIIDQTKNNNIKRGVFSDIILSNQYSLKDVLVVGDDPELEIKAAEELGIKVVLYDSLRLYDQRDNLLRITDFKDLENYLS